MNDRALEMEPAQIGVPTGHLTFDQALALVTAEYQNSLRQHAQPITSELAGYALLSGDVQQLHRDIANSKTVSANQCAARLAAHALRFMIDTKIG